MIWWDMDFWHAYYVGFYKILVQNHITTKWSNILYKSHFEPFIMTHPNGIFHKYISLSKLERHKDINHKRKSAMQY